VRLSHCWYDGLVTVWDEARLRRGHNDQSLHSHQCSGTTLTGESQFHISIPPGIEPRSLMTGSKGLTHWTSETVYEYSEIAGSRQYALSASVHIKRSVAAKIIPLLPEMCWPGRVVGGGMITPYRSLLDPARPPPLPRHRRGRAGWATRWVGAQKWSQTGLPVKPSRPGC
jgi:hypothetical protein